MTHTERAAAVEYIMENRPLFRGMLIDRKSAYAFVDHHGGVCRLKVGSYQRTPRAVVDAIYENTPKPVGFSPIIWFWIGKILIELLIQWWSNKKDEK